MRLNKRNTQERNKRSKKFVRLKKENEPIKDRVTRDTSNNLEQEEKDYYKSVRVGKFWRNYYVEN